MHLATYAKFHHFRDQYLESSANQQQRKAQERSVVLDVGSWTRDGQTSLRSVFPDPYRYIGLDLIEGPNVDYVPDDPFVWAGVDDNSVDAVVSSSTFEHNPYFWITMAEISRVLRPGGLVCLVAPSRGRVHRYPLDCWRFYPDAGPALCSYVGLEEVESSVESATLRKRMTSRVWWGDWTLVARKPEILSPDFSTRLEAILATRTSIPDRSKGPGRMIEAYDRQPGAGVAGGHIRSRLRNPIKFFTSRPPK